MASFYQCCAAAPKGGVTLASVSKSRPLSGLDPHCSDNDTRHVGEQGSVLTDDISNMCSCCPVYVSLTTFRVKYLIMADWINLHIVI